MKARDGSSVFLKHVRVGRTVYTTAPWLDQFFEAVAAADQRHFAGRAAIAAQVTKDAANGPPDRPAQSALSPNAVPPTREVLDHELRQEGL